MATTIHGVTMTTEAAQVVAETRTDVQEDVRRIITGEITPEELREDRIARDDDGDARRGAWEQYADAIDVATDHMLAHPASTEEIVARTFDDYRNAYGAGIWDRDEEPEPFEITIVAGESLGDDEECSGELRYWLATHAPPGTRVTVTMVAQRHATEANVLGVEVHS